MGLAVVVVLILVGSTGCAWDVSGHAGAKGFYPDKIQDKAWGDPRKAIYTPSFTERVGSGREQDQTDGFKGMGKEG